MRLSFDGTTDDAIEGFRSVFGNDAPTEPPEMFWAADFTDCTDLHGIRRIANET